jgi:hypothetical protein
LSTKLGKDLNIKIKIKTKSLLIQSLHIIKMKKNTHWHFMHIFNVLNVKNHTSVAEKIVLKRWMSKKTKSLTQRILFALNVAQFKQKTATNMEKSLSALSVNFVVMLQYGSAGEILIFVMIAIRSK